MKAYELWIRAVIVCDGDEGNPAHAWDGDAIADALMDEPKSGPKAHWHIASCERLRPEVTGGECRCGTVLPDVGYGDTAPQYCSVKCKLEDELEETVVEIEATASDREAERRAEEHDPEADLRRAVRRLGGARAVQALAAMGPEGELLRAMRAVAWASTGDGADADDWPSWWDHDGPFYDQAYQLRDMLRVRAEPEAAE